MEKNNYNLNERLDHIAYMFNVRTAGKKYENFIVNAIYTKVNDPELRPITQQYVQNTSDPRQYYLLDLYFPQLNYGVEIDERQHLDEAHQIQDKEREEAVKSAIQCEEFRIPIFTMIGNEPVERSYDDIRKDIDEVVQIIKKKIDENGGVKWETNEERKKAAIESGLFNIRDDVFYDSITEIYNLCGGRRTGKEKGKEVSSLRRCFFRLNDDYKLWVPILAIRFKDGTCSKARSGFRNFLSEDKTTITEISEKPWNKPLNENDCKRAVFMRMKDVFGIQGIRFIGVFKFSEESNDKESVRIYRRVEDSVRISDLK